MVEELNFAYTDVYTGKAQTGEINAQVSLNEVYSKLSAEMKGHIYTLDGTSTISLVDSNQSSITLLNDAEAIGSTGTAGQNTISVEIHEERESTSYYLESDGIYYPMCIRNFKVELDEENASTTQPTGAGSLGSGIEISFIDEGETEEKSESNYITASKSGTIITLMAKSNADGRTQVVVRDGEVTLTGNIEVTVNPTYTISLGTMTNGSVVIKTNNIDTTSSTKYGKEVVISLVAVSETGYEFDKWNDNDTTNPKEVTVIAGGTYMAAFKVNTYIGCYINKGTSENPEYAIIYADLLTGIQGTAEGVLGKTTLAASSGNFKEYSKSISKIIPTESNFESNYLVTVTGNNEGIDRFVAMKISNEGWTSYKYEWASARATNGWRIPNIEQWRRFASAFPGITKENYPSYGLRDNYWASDSWYPGNRAYTKFSEGKFRSYGRE